MSEEQHGLTFTAPKDVYQMYYSTRIDQLFQDDPLGWKPSSFKLKGWTETIVGSSTTLLNWPALGLLDAVAFRLRQFLMFRRGVKMMPLCTDPHFLKRGGPEFTSLSLTSVLLTLIPEFAVP